MKGGHNRKPTALKALHGTLRPDRANPNEPKPRPVVPPMPKGLDAAARGCWERNAPILERLGVLTEADLDLFVAYCQAWSRYSAATTRLRRVLKSAKDDLEQIRRAEVSVEKAEHSMRLLAQEFGLTPASRGRLSVGGEDDGESVLERLWAEKG